MTDLSEEEGRSTGAGNSSLSFVDRPPTGRGEPALLKTMMAIRAIDRYEGRLLKQGLGWIHIPSEGHETLAGLADCVRPDDLVFLYYRDRPLMHALGVSAVELAREFLGSAKSSTAGRGMPLHGSYRRLGIFPPATPTASQCLPAVGAAWGLQIRAPGSIVLCTIGDASTRQGEFYEAVAHAVQGRLPIVFVVEDNGFGISTRTSDQLPFRLGIFNEALFQRVDGRDIAQVRIAGQRAAAKARAARGPSVVWIELDRLGSHTNSDDQRTYRSDLELGEIHARDPLEAFSARLQAAGIATPSEIESWRSEVEREVQSAFDIAESEPAPSTASQRKPLGTTATAPRIDLSSSSSTTTTMVGSFNSALSHALQKWPNALIFGEDVEDPKGGVFGFTKGLSTAFPGRVVNSPLAEATILGLGAGLAATGFKPILELQFIDFLAPGFNQLITQIATLSWRSNGDWKCPVLIYAPYGAYLPAGSTWHSQSNEGIWTHIPGIRVAVPSTPNDLCGLFWAAMHDDEPTLLLIPKHIMRVRHGPLTGAQRPFGCARVVREGQDVTIVTWGNCVELAQRVAGQRAHRLSVEILDLVSLVPCDWTAVEQSVAKTGRLVVICEDNRTASFGQSVIAEMVSSQRRFDLLLSPPTLVARENCHIPFHPALEYDVLPDEARVHEALTQVMR